MHHKIWIISIPAPYLLEQAAPDHLKQMEGKGDKVWELACEK